MPIIGKQLTVRSHPYGTEVCIRDEYGHWDVICLNEEERNELLEKLRTSKNEQRGIRIGPLHPR